jgi:hypothetical protein
VVNPIFIPKITIFLGGVSTIPFQWGLQCAGTARFIFLRRDGLAVARSVARFVQAMVAIHILMVTLWQIW